MSGLQLFPVEASVGARHTDHLFFGLLAASAIVSLIVIALVVVFSIRYRKGSRARRGELPEVMSREFEIGWTSATLFLFLFFFWWAGSSQLRALQPPPGATEVHVVAKQWMWKVQYADGVREIDSLHVVTGRATRLVMTSQDVIHSFYVPAFRVKKDVLPGRYTELWFTPTVPGVYPLECAEYCGTDHSRMLGTVTVMSPQDFARWSATQPQAGDLAAQGGALFRQLGCGGCHGAQAAAAAPSLDGLYGAPVTLADGRQTLADEDYLRRAIATPELAAPAGWAQVMPSYAKAVDEGGLVALVAYIKSLSTYPTSHPNPAARAASPTTGAGA